uniref:hypothetical protein n=1 Tax=Aureimonas frigidaquae TaxID=424757 RepID=UPI000A7965EF
PRRITAGPLSVELSGGNLGAIRYRGHEILRAIAYIVRDRDWGTYDPALNDLSVEEGADGFTVTYNAGCVAPDGASLGFAARIEASSDGRLRFIVEATPRGDFETNRTGFCILHPIEGVAGQAVTVTHVDGSTKAARFPDAIAPWQPFLDIRALTHWPVEGLEATCHMDGDTFEMEDQRAWTDASFKTYVRPLARPWPYRLESGRTQRQCITLTIRETAPVAPRLTPDSIALTLGAADGTRMPAIGLSLAPAMLTVPDWADRIAEIGPQSLSFLYDPGSGHDVETLRAYAQGCAQAPRREHVLEFVVPTALPLDAVFADAARAVAQSGLAIDAVAVLADVDRQSTPPGSAWPACPPLDSLYAGAQRAFPGCRIGGGMFSYFTELNRKRVPTERLDFVTHATCAIVHAADDRSVMETLEAIPFITASTRGFCPDTPYRLGPTLIGMRQNPYGSRTMPNPDGVRVPMADDDPRARGLFGAAWLVGYAARLARTQLQSWIAGEFAGPRGIVLPDGAPTPAHAIVTRLAALAGLPRLSLASDAQGRVDGIAAGQPDGSVTLLLANLTAQDQSVTLPQTHVWDGQDGSAPLSLPPYATAWLTGRAHG